MPFLNVWQQPLAREDGFPTLLRKKHLEMPSTHCPASPDLKQVCWLMILPQLRNDLRDYAWSVPLGI